MRKLAALLVLIALLIITCMAEAAPRAKYTGIARTRSGDVIPSASVYVYLAGTSTAATVYATETSTTGINSVTTNSKGEFSFWVDMATPYAYTQQFKIIISKSGYTSQTYDNMYEVVFPTNSTGYLYNNGSGTFSWAAAAGDSLPTAAVGYLYNDGSDNLSWDTPAGTGDMVKATYDADNDGLIDSTAVDVPDLSATYDVVGTAASTLSSHTTAYDHAKFLSTSTGTLPLTETHINTALTDSTTGNASTTKHGFLPKLPSTNAARYYLDGTGTFSTISLASTSFYGQGTSNYILKSQGSTGSPTWDSVVTILAAGLTDVTTANATTSTHGLLPKLDGSSAKCLLGDGTWGSCGGAGSGFPITAGTEVGGFDLTNTGANFIATAFETIRDDAPSYITYYEATSDGDNYKTVTAPAKATGFAGNRTHTLGDYDSDDVHADDVNTAGHVIRFYDVDGTGYATITGLTAPRAYTLPDADGTFAMIGGNAYTGNHNFSGAAYVRLPTTDASASGQISIDGTAHKLLFHTGGAGADNALQSFDFDTCSAGYVMKTDGAGAWTCAADATAGTPALDTIANPTGAVTFTLLDNNASALSIGATGKADILKVITTDAGEGVTMSGTLGVTGATTFAGNVGMSGSATITAGGVILGDSSPDAAGELGYASGQFTFYGANSEDLYIEPGNASNSAVIGTNSGVTQLSFSAINTVTTGTVSGKLPTIVDATATTYNVTTAEARAGTFYLNTYAGTKTFVLPAAEAGMWVCVRNGQGVSQVLRIDTDGSDYIVKLTGARTSSAGDYYGATASANNQICVTAFDTTDWYVTSEIGTWSEE